MGRFVGEGDGGTKSVGGDVPPPNLNIVGASVVGLEVVGSSVGNGVPPPNRNTDGADEGLSTSEG